MDDYLGQPLKLRGRKKAKKSKPLAKTDLLNLLESAISDVVRKVESELRDSVNVTVDAPAAPAVELPNIENIVAQASQNLAQELLSSVSSSIDGVRQDIGKIKMPKPEAQIKGWTFNEFQYDDDGRLISFTADAE